MLRLVALSVAIVLASIAGVSTGPAGAQSSTVAPSTTVAPAAGSVRADSLPQPNSGVAPQASGDRGGAAQLTLMVLVFLAMALVVGRIAWATRSRTRAKATGV